ncbi:MAG: M6 family metalloprotease domain-containing protein [Bacteroidales bacterium]|nr:M6 family metalloprotease domain-containing protein [Bacteroidales bacterium]
MKRLFIVLAMLAIMPSVWAVPVFNMPTVRIQPNGDTVHLFVSGDEYYHRLHDANDYTIVQNPATGYWVYADSVHWRNTVGGENRWDVVATDYVVGVVNPATAGLNPSIGVDRETWLELQHRYDIPKNIASQPKTSGTNHGTMNNIVVFIRFSDETEISTAFSTIDAMFNDSSATSTSMYSYFKKVSYNKIFIPTHYFPTPNGNSIISFQDSLPRSYYMPYDATTNPNGYQNDNESRNREFSLLERAVNYINANYPVPTTINLDMDNDGKVDNICFVVKGTYTGWSDLLWPHKWSLYDRYVYINGKRVYTFNLQLEGSGSHYFSSSTFCHEMFHSLGAPDLYRYDVGSNVSGVGSWDLMCSNSTPPQHMSAYMKWKYGNWLDSIPQITVPGTYTLHSLGDDSYDNCCYKIAAQEPHQWYVLEYRDNTERFETALPGRGLLIFRIDDRYHGNASYDGVNTFDEVYLFRPGALNDSTNGTLSQAYFSGNTSRTQFTPNTNPYPWLTNNIIDTTIAITNVTSPGITISFTYNDLRGCRKPMDLAAGGINGTSAHLSWSGNAGNYRIQYKVAGTSGNGTTVTTSSPWYNLTGLALNTSYQWRVQGVCSSTDNSSYSDWESFTTTSCYVPVYDTIGSSDTSLYFLPLNTYYNYSYSQMIYTAAEMGGALNISKIAYNYEGSNQLSSKTDCIIYMGNTTQSSFSGTAMSNFVPFSQLTKVYEGPIVCTQGWNEIVLDTVFAYNGTDNLVIAIDDNSGDYDGSSYKFYCSSTGSNYRSLTYYSDSYNPDPTASSFSGSKSRRLHRPDIMFNGCPQNIVNTYTVTVSANNASYGTVSGGGSYDESSQATITATPATGYQFSHWSSNGTTITQNPYTFTVSGNRSFVAYFTPIAYNVSASVLGGGTVTGTGSYNYGSQATITANASTGYQFSYWISDGDTITQNPYTFTVTGDRSFVARFVQTVCNVGAMAVGGGSVSGSGSYTYGTQATLTATPFNHYHFLYWVCTLTGDTVSTNPYIFTVNGDISYTAYFEIDRHSVQVQSSDITAGQAWFVVNGSDEHLNDGTFDYGTWITLYALPTADNGVIHYQFDGWNDGSADSIHVVQVSGDMQYVASFSGHEVGISEVGNGITVSVDYRTITVYGADGRHIVLYDVLGRPLSQAEGMATNTFVVDRPGVYLLKVENVPTFKLLVR